ASVRIDRMIALPFSVVLIGFIASATHLGTPANALHVFSGVGRSPLSNEVLSAVAFLFLVGSYWMMAFKERFPDAVAKPWLALACLAGIALIACTSMAYNVDTVPTWDTAFTPANLVLAALLAGPVLGLLFLELAQGGRARSSARSSAGGARARGGDRRARTAPGELRHREQRVRQPARSRLLSCCHRRASHRRRDHSR
ncbi:MAG: dimethyl sulfoxide reductase anchor subunit family protein, partial [Eggerthellaceae bacterium]